MDTDKPAHGGRPMTLGEIARDEDRCAAEEPMRPTVAFEELPGFSEREIVWAVYYEMHSAVLELAAAVIALRPELKRDYQATAEAALSKARYLRDGAERDAIRREQKS